MTAVRTLSLILSLGFLASSASADIATFTFDQDGCTGTCGLSPYATLTLVENGSGVNETVTVTETLSAGERYAGTGAGEALEFNFSGTFILTSLTNHFSLGSGGATASAFGSFSRFISCDTCQGGKASNPSGPLSFTVGSATGVTIEDFTANSGGYHFASDIVGSNGKTGNVATLADGYEHTPAVPEPGSVFLMMSGLLAIGFLTIRQERWRLDRLRKPVAVAVRVSPRQDG